MKINQITIILISILAPVGFLHISNYEKELYISTAILFILLIFFRKYFFESDEENFKEIKIFNSKIFYFLILFFLLITQNRYLNLETITWDVSSYLVASNEIKLGNIPLESQWESKGPLTIYIYYLLSKITFSNYVFFKLLNDLILFTTIIITFAIFKKLDQRLLIRLLGCFFLVSVFSIHWFVSEFTEFYCLPLIALANYIFYSDKRFKNQLIGLLFGLSFLINQGSILLIFPLLLMLLKESSSTSIFFKTLRDLLLTFSIPNIFFLLLYFRKGILNIYLANYIQIPLGYTGENASSFYELRVFLREISYINIFTYLFIVTMLFIYFINLLKDKNFKLNNFYNLINLNILFSLFYYFLAGHNFYHHLIYFLYFFSFLVIKVDKKSQIFLISSIVFLSSSMAFITTYNSAIKNLSNLTKTYNEYPLKQLAQEIDGNFSGHYEVLALDFVLVLHYLDKTNYSYIVHPTNHFQKYITDELIRLNKIKENNIVYLLSKKPDVIICNTMSIDAGGKVISTDPGDYGEDVKEESNHFCDINNFQKDYFQLDTSLYRIDSNLNYYYDPYKEMNVFIKNESSN